MNITKLPVSSIVHRGCCRKREIGCIISVLQETPYFQTRQRTGNCQPFKRAFRIVTIPGASSFWCLHWLHRICIDRSFSRLPFSKAGTAYLEWKNEGRKRGTVVVMDTAIPIGSAAFAIIAEVTGRKEGFGGFDRPWERKNVLLTAPHRNSIRIPQGQSKGEFVVVIKGSMETDSSYWEPL